MEYTVKLGKSLLSFGYVTIDSDTLRVSAKDLVGKPVKYNNLVIGKVISAEWNDSDKTIDYIFKINEEKNNGKETKQ